MLQAAWQVDPCKKGVALGQQYVPACTYPEEQLEQAPAALDVQVAQPVLQAVQTLLSEKYPELQEAWQVVDCSTGLAVGQQ